VTLKVSNELYCCFKVMIFKLLVNSKCKNFVWEIQIQRRNSQLYVWTSKNSYFWYIISQGGHQSVKKCHIIFEWPLIASDWSEERNCDFASSKSVINAIVNANCGVIGEAIQISVSYRQHRSIMIGFVFIWQRCIK